MSGGIVGRFAPTPSGRLHLGNLFCALIAYLSTRRQNGRFLLRIEDLDLPRCPSHLSMQCIEDLRSLGFDWDEPPLFQSERTQIYRDHLALLDNLGLTYPCFCTRAQLLAAQAPNRGDTQVVYPGTCRSLSAAEIAERSKTRSPSVRLRVPHQIVSFTDAHFGPFAEDLARDCGDFILRRSDGLFGYQLAVVVDDALSGVTEVIRGEDILSATPRQIFLQRTFGFPEMSYAHIPLLVDSGGRRLAKRDCDLSLTALLTRFSPQEIIGVLAFCAGQIDRIEAVSLRELIPLFDLSRVPHGDVRLPENILSS